MGNHKESGLYYLTSRYYDPETGRFISVDALQVLTMTPMDLVNKNLYVYCDGKPVKREDVTGACWDIISSMAFRAAGSVMSAGLQAMVEGRQLSGKEILSRG